MPPAPSPSLQRPKEPEGVRGTAARDLERTHRCTWTSRSAVEKRDRVRGHPPMYKYMGSPGAPPESGEGRASGQRGVYPCLLPAAGATAL